MSGLTIRDCYTQGMTIAQAAKAMKISERAARARAQRLDLRFKANSHSRGEDETLLMILDLCDGDGVTAEAAGKRYGLTKGTVIGLMSRVRKAELACACTKAENSNGGMPRGWWKNE